ncbi:hypothetical protein HA402_007813 [Bradysia odoriphaga]|nr:hypothetical protein HA402_007813 [Bradysia odoriphaga]
MSFYDYFQTTTVFVVSIQLVFGVFRWIYQNVIGPNFLEPTNLRRYGDWALITGATDGIGKEYTRQLAKRGLNIILVSRTASKLKDVAKDIEETFNVRTDIIAVNFTSGIGIYDQIKQQIIGKEIGILVNNVGMIYPSSPDLFLNIPNREKVIQEIVNCNIISVPMMCSLILPQMVQRKRGLIINISSIASVLPSPSHTIYAASKAFVTKFSDDLGAEYGDQGIDVQSLITGGVSTNMNKMVGAKIITPSAEDYVESALRYVGYARNTSGFLAHSLLTFAIQLVSFLAPTYAERLFKNMMLAQRDESIKNGTYTPAK